MIERNIGEGACVGEESCIRSSAAIASGSCRGLKACKNNTRPISSDSCLSEETTCDDVDDCDSFNGACTNNTGIIGSESW